MALHHMERYRSGHDGTDSKFLEAPAVSSAENVRRTGLCAGSDFTISYRSCVFFLHSSGARITLEIYGELSERSKVRHSKFRRDLGISSPRKPLLIPGFQNSKSNTFMFSLLLFSPKDFASQKQAEIYGDVPKRLKGPHSKCGRSAQTDARVRISPSPPPKKPVIKPIMGFFLIPFSKSK